MLRFEQPLSLTKGGPFFRLLRRGGLLDPHDAPAWPWLALLAWLPLVAASLARLMIRGQLDPVTRDSTVHVRFLIALPLFVIAERMLEARCASATHRLRDERVIDRPMLDAILDRAERLRDAPAVEGALAAAVVVFGLLSVCGVVPGHLSHGSHDPFSIAKLWYLAVALPLLQFLMLRWLWRWVIWSYVLVRLSRCSLATNALHPDHASGLGILATPIDAFAIYTAAYACLGASAWIAAMSEQRATLHGIAPAFLAFVIVVVGVACGPLLVFMPHLYQVRHQGMSAYHVFAHEYVGAFRRKWIHSNEQHVAVSPPGTEDLPSPALGTADIQSLNDLMGSFSSVGQTRLYPFGVRSVAYLCAGAFAPMVPVLLSTMPLQQVVSHLGKMLFGLAP